MATNASNGVPSSSASAAAAAAAPGPMQTATAGPSGSTGAPPAPTPAPASTPNDGPTAGPSLSAPPLEMPPNDPSSTAVVLHVRPPAPEEPDVPAPRPRTPPHRRQPPPRPRKGILKPPPPPQAKFSFKRDILAPVSSRLGYAEVAESPLGAVMLSANAGGVGQGVQAAAGWVGSAWKRLGAAAVAERARLEGQGIGQGQARASPTLPQNDLGNRRVRTVDDLAAPSSSRDSSPSRPIPPRRDTAPTSGPTVPPHLRDPTSPSSVSASAPNSPTQPPAPTLSVKMLKKVHFTMADLKVVYNISNVLAPSVEATTKERTETAFQARRRASSVGEARGWTAASLEALYDECCRTREEGWGLARVRQALKDSAPAPPKSLDLTGVACTVGSIEALGDLLSVDFGLKKLVMEGCGLDDDMLKPLLHALLVSGSLPTLSLANNRRIRTKGWKAVATFVRKVGASSDLAHGHGLIACAFQAAKLRYLDLSENNLDRRSVEYLNIAISGSTESLPDTPLGTPRGPASPSFGSLPGSPKAPLSSLPHSPVVPSAPLPDPPSTAPKQLPSPEKRPSLSSVTSDENRLFSDAPLLRDDASDKLAHADGLISLRLENCSLRGQALETLAQGVRLSHLKHISLRRNRISQVGAIALAVLIRDWPTTGTNPFAGMETEFGADYGQPRLAAPPLSRFESSNSVTARQQTALPRRPAQAAGDFASSPLQPSLPITNGSTSRASEDDEEEHFGPERRSIIAASVEKETKRAAEARQRLRKQIDPLPRVGALLTLDVKSNDIRSGAAYLAQVLKRNRTLRVLNLSDNKIDMVGLVSLADALVSLFQASMSA